MPGLVIPCAVEAARVWSRGLLTDADLAFTFRRDQPPFAILIASLPHRRAWRDLCRSFRYFNDAQAIVTRTRNETMIGWAAAFGMDWTFTEPDGAGRFWADGERVRTFLDRYAGRSE